MSSDIHRGSKRFRKVGDGPYGLARSVKIKTRKLSCSKANMGKGSPSCEREEACV
jgi:hypothetical protein